MLTFEGFLSKIKDRFDSSTKTEYRKELKQYDLKIKSLLNKQGLNIYHNDRLVGDIILSDDNSYKAIWVLTVYFYEDEIVKDGTYKKPNPIDNQKAQPYAKGSKKFPSDSDTALRAFIMWWSNNNKSGKLKNPKFKVRD